MSTSPPMMPPEAAAASEATGTLFDAFPRPPAATLLGWRLLGHDAAKGWIKISFDGSEKFLNPAGFIQGGLLAAMLDDTMGPAVLLHTDGALYTATIDLHVSFLAPARPGPLVAEAQVLQCGNTIAFIEGRIMDAHSAVLARATASARLVPTQKLAR